MTQRILALLSIVVAAVSAFTVQPSAVVVRPSTALPESFGFDFAEDSYENTPEVILGEANYKQWINKVDKNAFLNRQVRKILFCRKSVSRTCVLE
jgi:hypothetical protein